MTRLPRGLAFLVVAWAAGWTLLAGCQSAASTTFIPSPTNTASPTPLSTATATLEPPPSPTAAPTQTASPIPAEPPEIVIATKVALPSGGFTVAVPELMENGLQFSADEIAMLTFAGTVRLVMGGGRDSASPGVDEMLESLKQDIASGTEDFESGEPFEAIIGGVVGLAVDYSGSDESMPGDPIQGRLFAAEPYEGQYLVGFITAVTAGPYGNHWEPEALPLLDKIFETLVFMDLSEQAGNCEMSDDPAFGYAEDNPIRVGGDAFGGPARARTYLDNLLGPDGQAISYERKGSISTDETILDLYQVTYPGISSPVTLYVDQYSYAEPQAPVGFTCAGPFPLQSP